MTKLSDLTAMTAANLTGADLITVQDVEDTVGGWTRGHNKKMTVAEFNAGLASLGGGNFVRAGVSGGQTAIGGTQNTDRLLLKATASATPTGGGIGAFGGAFEVLRVIPAAPATWAVGKGQVIMGDVAGAGLPNTRVGVLQGVQNTAPSNLPRPTLVDGTAFAVVSDNQDTTNGIACAMHLQYNVSANNPTEGGYPTSLYAAMAMTAADFVGCCTQVHGFQNMTYADVPAKVVNGTVSPDTVPYAMFSGQHLARIMPGVGDRANAPAWVAAHAYAKGDTVRSNNLPFVCITAHTSGGAGTGPNGLPTTGVWRRMAVPPLLTTVEADARDDSAGCASDPDYYNTGSIVRVLNAGNADLEAGITFLATPSTPGRGGGTLRNAIVCTNNLKSILAWNIDDDGTAVENYIVGDTILVGGIVYQCKVAHVPGTAGHGTPPGNTADWRVRQGSGLVSAGERRTTGVTDNFLWLGPTSTYTPTGTPDFKVAASGDITTSGFLEMIGRTEPTGIAGRGRLYVRSSDGKLMYKNGTAAAVVVA